MTKKTQLPIARVISFGVYFSSAILLIVATFFRLWRLDTLPPGLTTGEARFGLEVLGLIHHGWLPGLTSSNFYAPVFVWLQAVPVSLLGPTSLSLHILPALIGVGAVVMTLYWARDWFGARIGWIAAFAMAISPWAIEISRSSTTAALLLFLTPTTLFLAGKSFRRGDILTLSLFGLVLAINLGSGPLGWLLDIGVIAFGVIKLAHHHKLMQLGKARAMGLTLFGIGASGLAFEIAVSTRPISHLIADASIVSSVSSLLDSISRTLVMFNIHGDENIRHNLTGEPLLNAFIGLMFVAGFLVSLSRLNAFRYRVIVGLFGLFLLPVILSTKSAPNASYAVLVLPITMILVGVGTSYMLKLWYVTFPINSAARSLGQAVIILLLGLSLFQGYTQYFRAWSQSIETFQAFNESGVAISKSLLSGRPNSGTSIVLANHDEEPVVDFLASSATYKSLSPDQIQALPEGKYLFIISPLERDSTTKALTLKFPGSKLIPHLSGFSQNEIYYTYNTNN